MAKRNEVVSKIEELGLAIQHDSGYQIIVDVTDDKDSINKLAKWAEYNDCSWSPEMKTVRQGSMKYGTCRYVGDPTGYHISW